VLLGGVAATVTSCVPQPPSATTPLVNPPAGCFDGNGNLGSDPDLSYTGVPNVPGNASLYYSTDGTCQNQVPPGIDDVMVVVKPRGSDTVNWILSMGYVAGCWSSNEFPDLGPSALVCRKA
jgi:hypothetical protein